MTFIEEIDKHIEACEEQENIFIESGMITSGNCSGAMKHSYQRARQMYIEKETVNNLPEMVVFKKKDYLEFLKVNEMQIIKKFIQSIIPHINKIDEGLSWYIMQDFIENVNAEIQKYNLKLEMDSVMHNIPYKVKLVEK